MNEGNCFFPPAGNKMLPVLGPLKSRDLFAILTVTGIALLLSLPDKLSLLKVLLYSIPFLPLTLYVERKYAWELNALLNRAGTRMAALAKVKGRYTGEVHCFHVSELNYAFAAPDEKELLLSSFIDLCCSSTGGICFTSISERTGGGAPDDRQTYYRRKLLIFTAPEGREPVLLNAHIGAGTGDD